MQDQEVACLLSLVFSCESFLLILSLFEELLTIPLLRRDVAPIAVK